MKKFLLFFCGIYVFPFLSFSQCPQSSFTNPGILCSQISTPIINTSSGANAFEWDFCGGDFNHPHVYATDDPSSPDQPSSISLVYDSVNWYGFLFNYGSMTITRYDYGSSLDNIPTTVDLGNLGGAITGSVFWNDMSFIKEGENWYAVFTLYGAAKIVLVSFGSTLNNPNPVATSYTNGSFRNSLAFQELKIDNGNIYVFVARDALGQIFRLNFGNSITNTPALDVIDLTVVSSAFDELGDISLVKYCDHWYGFVTSYSTNSILRLDFGNSLSNIPSVVSLGNPNNVLFFPWSIEMVFDGENWYAFEVNFFGTLNKISFGNDLTNITPTGISLTYPGINGIGSSAKIAKMNSAFYLFLCSRLDSKFSKVKYEAPCSASPQISFEQNPIVHYDSGGTYIINLASTDGGGNVSFFSDSVEVNYAPIAHFSVYNTCFNDVTLFQDSSSFFQGIITKRIWDFGDSSMDSTIVSPTHQYASPGTYGVSLTLIGSLGCDAVLKDSVTIGDIPVANFSTTPTTCSNIPIVFTDMSSVGFDNAITKWKWEFGNGDSSNLQNPVYTYPEGGTYTVTLTITTNYNCSAVHQSNIVVNSAPETGFLVSNTCIGEAVVFTDTSNITSDSIVNWVWDFGDSDTSTLQNPSHNYTNTVASYNVSLITTSQLGCSDTLIKAVKINNVPVSSFSISPVTICEGSSINLTDLSTVSGDTIFSWHWDFGDGFNSVDKNPSHAYADSGHYDITLTVFSETSCPSSHTLPVTVIKSPSSSFSFTTVCLGDSVYFSDHSTPASGTILVSWHWDFGDGDTSAIPSPAHLYSSAGNFNVTLTVTDNIGCTNFYTALVAVHQLPDVGFAGTMGCSGNAINFADTSISIDGAITDYHWNFGDFSSADSVSLLSNPSHIYFSAGVYDVKLVVTTQFGCSSEIVQTVEIRQASPVNFQYFPACEKQQTIFTNLDTLPAIDSLWNWSFGDGGVSFIQSPSHYYFLPGIYDVTLTVTAISGCVSSITKSVEVKPNPVADFVTAPACLNTPYVLQDISHVSQGNILKWDWSFGNGDSSTLQFPTTEYHDTGDYVVTLRVISDTVSGCTNSIDKIVHVYDLPIANFNFNPLFGSPPLNVHFNNLSIGASAYSWDFGDGGTSTLSSPSHVFADTGKFTIEQVVYSSQGCADSVSKVFYVIKPRLDIAISSISYQLQDDLFKISAEVINLGTRDISNYKMQAFIQDGSTIEEEVNTLLPSGSLGRISYNFNAAFHLGVEQKVDYYCVRALSPNGETEENVVNNEKCATQGNDFSALPPYPNPFNDYLQLQFIIPYKGYVLAELYDAIGQKIETLFDEEAGAGGTVISINTNKLGFQVYYCRLTFQGQTLVYPVTKLPIRK